MVSIDDTPSLSPAVEPNTTFTSELLARAARFSGLASYVWHLPSGPLEWSEQLFLLLGLDPERDEASVELFFSHVHPDDVDKMPNVVQEVHRGRLTGATDRFRIIRKDGTQREVLSRWTVSQESDGTPRSLYGTLLDVTDALQENDRLSRALEELASAQRLANVGSWHWDLVTHHIEWSEQLYRIMGYDRSVVPSQQAWLSRIHPDDIHEFPQGDCDASRDNQFPPAEFRIIQPSGEVRWVFMETETSLDGAGRPARARGVVWDVTDRRRLEERLREATRMEAVGRLAGGLAHDFNNLLTIVQANVDRLRRGNDDRCLTNIETAVRTASDLTQRLLAFSRQAAIRPKNLDLNQAVSSALSLLQGIISPSIQVRFETGNDIPTVRLDESQIHQVLINLITNARDAMPHGGQLCIGTSQVTIAAGQIATAGGHVLPQGRYAVLTVRDDGSGMSPEVCERIFEPFYTTKAPGHGTGLGLATVFGIVSQHGGAVEVESKLDEGSCFRIYFPAIDQVAREQKTPSSAPPVPARVLLVEDNDLIREPITFLLREAGYTVHVAAGAAEARRLWGEHQGRFDVLMTDIVMPGDSGTQLARELRTKRPDLRVLFMTGHVAPSSPEPDAHTEVLQKPFRLHVPLDAIQRLMGAPGARTIP